MTDTHDDQPRYVSVPLTERQLHLLLEAVGGPYVTDPERSTVARVLLVALGGASVNVGRLSTEDWYERVTKDGF